MGQFKPHQLPESFRKRMAKEQRKELGVTTMEEVNEKRDRVAERMMHMTFENWLRLNGVQFVHSRTDKRHTCRVGTLDYVLLRNGFGCAIEMKTGDNKPTKEQLEVIAELREANVPVRVCYSVEEAIAFAKEHLKL